MIPELFAVHRARALGADASEELDAYRAARKARLEASKERLALEVEVENVFFAKGWK